MSLAPALGVPYPGLYAPPPAPPWLGDTPVITTIALPTLFPLIPYATTIEADGGNAPPYVFWVRFGALPPNLSLSLPGVLSGTAPAVAEMLPATLLTASVDQFYSQQLAVADVSYAFTVRVADTIAQVDDQSYTLALWENPTVFTLAAGPLVGCMSLRADGLLAGRPLRVGPWPITIRATDALGRTFDKTYIFTVTS